MLPGLHQDHINISKLLRLLRHKLAAIREGRPVRYRLIRDMVDYLREVTDKRHHPKEELIYDYYLKYRMVELDEVNRLKTEHRELMEAGEELREAVNMILMDAVIPLEQFADRLESFIELQQSHIGYEEECIFPRLRECLTEDDWRHLEQNWQHRPAEDPLFGTQVSQQFRELADRLGMTE